MWILLSRATQQGMSRRDTTRFAFLYKPGGKNRRRAGGICSRAACCMKDSSLVILMAGLGFSIKAEHEWRRRRGVCSYCWSGEGRLWRVSNPCQGGYRATSALIGRAFHPSNIFKVELIRAPLLHFLCPGQKIVQFSLILGR
jgi:hypothetical protein